MGVHEGSGTLAKALKELLRRWGEAKANWSDANSEDFEKTSLHPLERDMRGATNAMDHMSQVLAQARRDCQ
jgi:hypothetical protein